jgi:hypothetical protein
MTEELATGDPGSAPPDWYPDPGQPNTLRYWDGRQWTDQRAPAGNQAARRPSAAIVGLVAAGAMALGAIGPWVDAVFVTVGGLNGDGVIVLLLAVVAAAVLGFGATGKTKSFGWLGLLAALCGLVACAVSVYDLSQILGAKTDLFGEDVRIGNPGWGLWLSAVASGALVLAGIALAGSKESTE